MLYHNHYMLHAISNDSISNVRYLISDMVKDHTIEGVHMKCYTMWMTIIDTMTVVIGAAMGYLAGRAIGIDPMINTLLLDTLRSLTGISGIDLTAFMTVIGLYVGIVCVVFGLLWQLPQPSVYNNYPNGKD